MAKNFVRNKDRLMRKLAALHPTIANELNLMNKAAAEQMAEYARQFVPVKTGKLKESIVVTPPGETPPPYSQGGVQGRPVPDNAYAVSAGNSGVRTAHLVEYGTTPHTLGGFFEGAEHPGSRARPFFWPAYRITKRKHKRESAKALTKAIKKVAGIQ